jgi:SHS2 domain-containing protein
MKKFEVLEHTADAKFRAYGKSMEEAFENAAFAMASLMYDPEMVASFKIEKIKVEGKDWEQLLYSFLEELLVLQDSKQFVLHGFVQNIQILENRGKLILKAKISGDTIKDEYEVRPTVKAMTYAEIEISEKPIYLQFVVDI